ncbi:hypothetical protein GCM10008931_17280 [Oceanobacillus oncorhynchi subsp. oncorhynchi]
MAESGHFLCSDPLNLSVSAGVGIVDFLMDIKAMCEWSLRYSFKMYFFKEYRHQEDSLGIAFLWSKKDCSM